LTRIAAQTGWAETTASGNAAPVIAVIDTGFALNHQDLVGRWDGTQGTSSWLGWDFVDNNNDPMAGATDPNGTAVFHGTMTAGLAGLLNPNAKLMPLQALSDEGVGFTDEIAAAVHYAVVNGANIISLSLGGTSNDSYLEQQIEYAISSGVTVVAASGNSGCNCLSYPAAYPGVLSVGATDASDNVANFSSYGSGLGVVAPGTAGDVCSSTYTATNATSAYTCAYSGTSFATPITAGLAALMLQEHPGLSPPTVVGLIEASADKIPSMSGQYTSLTAGYGRIDVAKAIALVTNKPPGGELANQTTISLANSPQGISTCTGIPGTGCDLVLNGPSGQSVDLGTQTLDANGGAVWTWNAATLGLATGQWTANAKTNTNGQTVSFSTAITISP
jgi:subtilisin family serine protease